MPSIVRKPFAIVSLGGVEILCEECSVKQTKKGTSSSFSAKAPLTVMTEAGAGLDWIAEQTEIQVQVSYDAGDGNAVPMFTGTVDKIDIDVEANAQTVLISGRDDSKKLKDAKSNQKFTNLTSQEAAQQIVSEAGMTLNTDGNTGLTGRIYTQEQVKLTNNPSAWQALRQLGEAEGKVHAVINGQVYFRELDDDSLPVYPVSFTPAKPDSQALSSSVIKIKLGRDFNAAKQTNVTVKSWDHKKKQLITSTTSSGSGAPPQNYSYVSLHHKTQDQADRHARSKLKEHSRHEFDITIDMPGDTSLTPLYQIGLSGTNSGFDQNYNIDDLDHKMSVKDGYRMSATTKAAKKGRNK